MAVRDMKIIDADGHVMEPAGLWVSYIDPVFRVRAPRVVRLDDGHTAFFTDGYLSPRPECISRGVRDAFARTIQTHLADSLRDRFSPASQLRAMDLGGVDVSFLYPTLGLFAASIDGLEPAFAIAICRAYNTWLHEFCREAPDRLRPVAMLVGLHDPQAATGEAIRVAALGFRGVFIRPNPVRGRTLADPAYTPLWEACERLGLTIGVHGGVGTHLPDAGADRFTTFFACHAASHPVEQMLAMLALISGGVLERHPKLRVAFLEAGCGWLPYWLWRMDEHWQKTRGIAGEPELPLAPSEYFRRQCWISFEPDEPYLPDIIHRIGEDRLLFASDYPHPDHVWPETVEAAVALPLADSVKRKIFRDNPARLYGLDPDDLTPVHG
jgi:predicted TIM-barrel fold metal-dependent hydrolase